MPLGEYVGAGSGTTRLLARMSSNPNDSSGNSQTATATNVTYAPKFLNNSALLARASTADIKYTDAASLQLGTGDFTFSALVTPNTVNFGGADEGTVCSKTIGAFELFIYLGTFAAYVNYPTGIINGSTSLTIGQKYHVVLRRIGSAVNLFVNGKLDGSTTASGSISAAGSDFYLGRRTGGSFLFDGYIDEAIFESVGWSNEKIRRYYSMVKGRTAIL